MIRQNIKNKQGFTIIEVVLVLAIAGLIFLMVFIALPALQRSQRDTQRRNDYSMLSSAITSFSTSNQGKLYRLAGAQSSVSTSSCLAISARTYINAEGTDPNGQTYQPEACTWAGWAEKGNSATEAAKPANRKVYVIIGADCTGYDARGYSIPKRNTSSRAFAIYGYMEGDSGTYCSASQ